MNTRWRNLRLRRWLREPLLHFLVIGAALFVLFYQVADDPEAVSNNRIVISEADTDRLIALFERKWQRLPSQQELNKLVEAEIREEILYREALAMGLDEDDTIVRRRMAQKMEFLFGDLAESSEPTDEELQRFLNENPDRFVESRRTSFVHVYLSADKRGANTERDAQRILSALRAGQEAPDLAAVGDPFIMGYRFDNQSDHQVARLFGADFGEALSSVEIGSWQGPIASAYGLHLAYLHHRTEARLPTVAEIREAVRHELLAVRRREANQAFYKTLRDRYTVVVEQPSREQRVASADSIQ